MMKPGTDFTGTVVDPGGRWTMHCDTLERAHANIASESVDLIFADPPYGFNNLGTDDNGRGTDFLARINDEKRHNTKANVAIGNDGRMEALYLISDLIDHSYAWLKPDSVLCIMCAGGGPDPIFSEIIDMMTPGRSARSIHCRNEPSILFDHLVVWDKRNPGMGRRYRRGYEFVVVAHKGAQMSWHRGLYNARPNIISIAGVKKREHPNEKPAGLALEFVLNHTPVDGVVLDPCAGSGSTGVAALRAGRRFIGIEPERKWFDIAVRRLRDASRGVALDLPTTKPVQAMIEETIKS